MWPSLKIVCYSFDSENSTKSYKSRGSKCWVHFKNTQKTAQAINVIRIWKDVILQNQMCVIPSLQWQSWWVCQAHSQSWMQGQWPKKSVGFLLHMLKNAEYWWPYGSRCRFSAHWGHPGEQSLQDALLNLQIHMSSFCHIEMILTKKNADHS